MISRDDNRLFDVEFRLGSSGGGGTPPIIMLARDRLHRAAIAVAFLVGFWITTTKPRLNRRCRAAALASSATAVFFLAASNHHGRFTSYASACTWLLAVSSRDAGAISPSRRGSVVVLDSPAPPNSAVAKLLLLRVMLSMDTADKWVDLLLAGGRGVLEAFLPRSSSFGRTSLILSNRSRA